MIAPTREVKQAVVVWAGSEERMYEVSGLRLPFFLGGAQKNVAENIKILQRDHSVTLVLMGLRRVPTESHAPGVRIVPIAPLFGTAFPSANLIRTLAASRPFGLPGSRREPGVLLVHDQLWPALLCKLMLPGWRVCLILENRFRNLAWSPRVPTIALRAVYFLCALLSVLSVDRIVVVSSQIWPMTSGLGWLRAKTRYIPNSIDPDLFRPEGRHWRPAAVRRSPRIRVLLYVGRLAFEAQKDPGLLFHAFRRVREGHPELHLVVVGVERRDFRTLLLRHNGGCRKNIHLVSIVANDVLPPIFRGADLTVLTSRYEGTPYVVLESLACGTPVVTTPVVERGLIEDGVNGCRSQASTPEAFAGAIERGLELSESLRAARRRRLLPSRFDVAARAENLLRVLLA
ncbi:MAG: glycosyltransferase family 4 protein [Acidobacteria bacterium]|nr:glycosyltransferase family 4 protein [Acidobacteriota bacterium]